MKMEFDIFNREFFRTLTFSLKFQKKGQVSIIYIPVNLPPFRGNLPRKSLISRMDWVSCAGDINLPHTPFPPPQQKGVLCSV